jgi:hypothetical protein
MSTFLCWDNATTGSRASLRIPKSIRQVRGRLELRVCGALPLPEESVLRVEGPSFPNVPLEIMVE